MDYIVYQRFKDKGIEGDFNLPFGTICAERGGFLFAPDGRQICAVTSENGWGHFRANTPEGAYRQEMLERLYAYYGRNIGAAAVDFNPEKWPGAVNTYWKSLLRTMRTEDLTAFYRARLGTLPEMEGKENV